MAALRCLCFASRPDQPIRKMQPGIDSKFFRHVLGHYPTGVCAITSVDDDGAPIGMAVGSFTSVSLDPPLVAFFPDKCSSSWPRIEATGRFCVNVLADCQESLCRALASKADNKFSNLSYHPSSTGLPVFDDIVAWIDCEIYAVHEAGDHFIVVGKVHSLDTALPENPLLFLRGGYGRFFPLPTGR